MSAPDEIVVSPEGMRVLAGLRVAQATSGALAPHLAAIMAEVPGLPYFVVRDRLLGLSHLGLVEQQGDRLEFALTSAGDARLGAAA